MTDSSSCSALDEETVETRGGEATAADVLGRAADLLEEFGWCQGRMGSKARGEMCLMGAALEAALDCGCPGGYTVMTRGPDEGDALPYADWPAGVDDAIHRIIEDPCPFGNVGRWNDVPGRTKAEVVAKLREAAEFAKAGSALACGETRGGEQR